MCSVRGCRWIAAAGFPIRKSPDHRLYTASRGLSQCPTSFFGIWRQGIHRKPLVTYPRDAEKSKLFSSVRYVTTALTNIQLLMYEFVLLGGLLPRGGSHMSLSETPLDRKPIFFCPVTLRKATRLTAGSPINLAMMPIILNNDQVVAD
jgi:hypothetical protein